MCPLLQQETKHISMYMYIRHYNKYIYTINIHVSITTTRNKAHTFCVSMYMYMYIRHYNKYIYTINMLCPLLLQEIKHISMYMYIRHYNKYVHYTINMHVSITTTRNKAHIYMYVHVHKTLQQVHIYN